MTIKYDTVADAVYVGMIEGSVAKTVKVNDRLNMDLDADGNTLGIEILDASSQEEMIENIRKNVSNGVPVSIDTSTPAVA